MSFTLREAEDAVTLNDLIQRATNRLERAIKKPGEGELPGMTRRDSELDIVQELFPEYEDQTLSEVLFTLIHMAIVTRLNERSGDLADILNQSKQKENDMS